MQWENERGSENAQEATEKCDLKKTLTSGERERRAEGEEGEGAVGHPKLQLPVHLLQTQNVNHACTSA